MGRTPLLVRCKLILTPLRQNLFKGIRWLVEAVKRLPLVKAWLITSAATVLTWILLIWIATATSFAEACVEDVGKLANVKGFLQDLFIAWIVAVSIIIGISLIVILVKVIKKRINY